MANAIGLVLAGAVIAAALVFGQRYQLLHGQEDVVWRVDRVTGETCRIWFPGPELVLYQVCEIGVFKAD
jgi:hypothetical protein